MRAGVRLQTSLTTTAMNAKFIFAILLFAAGATAGILLFRQSTKPVETPQRLGLEQILTIKELHLVRHTYQDLFFLHKDNNQNKPVRAIVRVPVTITAFIDLKKIKIVHEHDSVKQVVLPRATLNVPLYRVDEMVVTKTRAFQLHAGEDLYPAVSSYLAAVVAERIKVVNQMALAHDILQQAEAEAKAYVEWLLRCAGYQQVVVTFGEEDLDKKAEGFKNGVAIM
jgi:hypothetical protein